jgi:hypothetical protein
MKVKRRKFNIFEQMELAYADSTASGPVEEYILTPDEFREFVIDAKNRPGTSFRKVIGRPDDDLGGDWHYRGALVKVNGKIKS